MARRRRARRLRDGHRCGPADAPLPRAPGRRRGRAVRADARPRGARPRAGRRRRAVPARDATSGRRAPSTRAGTSSSSRSSSTAACRAGAGRSADIVLEREVAMTHGAPRGRRRAPAVRADRPVTPRAHAALHVAQRARRAAAPRGDPDGRGRRRTASSSRAPTASPAPGGSRAAPGTAACARARRPRAGSTTSRTCGRREPSRSSSASGRRTR